MKFKYITTVVVAMLLTVISCDESFLEVSPPGSYSEPSLQNLKGVEGMLIAAYSGLDGSWFESWGNNHFNQNGGASNWIWGAMRGDDSYKGTEESDGVDLNPIERHETLPSNPYLNNKWDACYDGIGKSNAVLRTLAALTDVDAATLARIQGEARFLRAHYHFEAVKVFKNPPFVDETITDFPAVKNDVPAWASIEADLQYAYDNLPDVMNAAGRANKYAAGAYLAKVMVFQGKWAEAKPILTDVINNGVTAAGTPLALHEKFSDNFSASMESGSPEMIFAYEASYGDGSISNGNYENTLNQPHGSTARTSCCGFFQPSQTLVNAFKTENGLPQLDTYNDTDVPSDEGLALTDPFTPYAGDLDPRIDWTVGRRGIPFLDWGEHPGSSGAGYVRKVDNGGPFSPVKTVPRIADFDNNLAGVIDWGFTSSALNVQIMRFADVILMLAEVEAELNNLQAATDLVNQIRRRAANADGFVKTDAGDDAASYVINEYPAFGSQTEALKAIRFERLIELAMEGHRMFDLVRWQEATDAGNTAAPFDIVAHLNSYLTKEQADRVHLANASFDKKYMYMPIPERVITQSTVDGVQNIVQNPGF